MSLHERLLRLRDHVSLLDLEPGVMSKQKQAMEILSELQKMPKDELSVEDVELLDLLKGKTTEIIQA